MSNTWDFLQTWDVVSGLIKAAVFGFIVALIGCYHGFNASGGARGVGRATTHAVVSGAILIFASDYLLDLGLHPLMSAVTAEAGMERCSQALRGHSRARRLRPLGRSRPVPGDHRRIWTGQVGGHQDRRRTDPPDAGEILMDGQPIQDLNASAWRELAGAFRHAVSGRGPVRQSAGLGERRLPPDQRRPRAAQSRPGTGAGGAGAGRASAASPPTSIRRNCPAACRSAWAWRGPWSANPDIIFFDEPTTGLDPITGRAINALITEQVKGLGCTAVTITHDLASARMIGDEIAMLNGGVIVWRGPVSDLDRSGNPYVDQFVRGDTEGPIQSIV